MDLEIIAPAEQGLAIGEAVGKTMLAFFSSFESPHTAREYLATAKEFLNFAGPSISSLSELSRDHLIMYQNFLRTKGQAQKTILKKLSAVSSLCKHLAFEGLVDKDLSYGLKRPKSNNRKETADFSDQEVKKIFAALDPKKKCFTSHRALLAIGFYTGLRSAEIRNLKIKNLTDVNGHRVLNLVIKGSKPHEVPLNPFCYRAIIEHIAKLAEFGFNVADPEQWLFPSLNPMRNQPISNVAFNKILKLKLKAADLAISTARRYSPHSMRATLAGHLLNKVEAPLEQVQKMLGHSSPTTTMRYNKRAQDHDKSPAYKIEY